MAPPNLITFRGETKSVAEWSRSLGVGLSLIQVRLRNGASVEEALTKPSARKPGLSCLYPDEHRIWRGILHRCRSRSSRAWRHYGGRGIRVCRRWLSFANFMADLGPRPSRKHGVERKNNDGHYDPGNCVWATQKEQCRNQRRNRRLTYRGVTRCLSEWAEVKGLHVSTLKTRLRDGWTIARALITPKRHKEAP